LGKGIRKDAAAICLSVELRLRVSNAIGSTLLRSIRLVVPGIARANHLKIDVDSVERELADRSAVSIFLFAFAF
jgi:hypothetical protein